MLQAGKYCGQLLQNDIRGKNCFLIKRRITPNYEWVGNPATNSSFTHTIPKQDTAIELWEGRDEWTNLV